MPFRKPASKRVGLKVLLKGEPGTGKTISALSFPKIAALDAENGMSLYEGTEDGKNLSLVANTQSYQELDDAILYVEDNHEDDDIQTVVIDSETKFYENMKETIMEVEERRARQKGRDVLDTNLSIRSWGKIGQIADRLQNLKIDLSSQGVNIVSVTQTSEVKEKQGDNFVVTGHKAEMRKGAEFDYDIVLTLYTEENESGDMKYLARVEKDRSRVFNRGDIIENPRYELWEERISVNKDKDALNTSYGTQIEDDKKSYEESVEEEEKSLKDRMTDLSKNADDATKKKIMAALKSARITSFEGLTTKQQENLEKIYDKFK